MGEGTQHCLGVYLFEAGALGCTDGFDDREAGTALELVAVVVIGGPVTSRDDHRVGQDVGRFVIERAAEQGRHTGELRSIHQTS